MVYMPASPETNVAHDKRFQRGVLHTNGTTDVHTLEVGGSIRYVYMYRKVSNISRTKSQNLNDSHLVLKSSLPNPLKPGVKSRMKM